MTNNSRDLSSISKTICHLVNQCNEHSNRVVHFPRIFSDCFFAVGKKIVKASLYDLRLTIWELGSHPSRDRYIPKTIKIGKLVSPG